MPIPRELKTKLSKRARKLKNQGRLRGSVDDYVWATWRKIEEKKRGKVQA